MKPLSKLHAEAVAKAKTDDDKVKAAAVAMIETPMEMIRAILLKHEQAVIEVMKELSEERDRAAAAEREACATVCEDIFNDPKGNNGDDYYYTRPYLECAAAIRTRGRA